MSHPSKVELLRQARHLGYRVVMFFVALESADLSVERVRQRVALGGHSVPEDRIKARYFRTLSLLPDALAVCDRAVLFDNSYRREPNGVISLRPFCEVRRFRSVLRYFSADGTMIISSTELRDFPLWAADVVPEKAMARQRRSYHRSWDEELAAVREGMFKATIENIRRKRKRDDP